MSSLEFLRVPTIFIIGGVPQGDQNTFLLPDFLQFYPAAFGG